MIFIPILMNLRYRPYELKLRHRFTIAGHSRTSTPALLVRIESEGVIGYGEAAMPPYLGESVESASRFLSRVRLPDRLTQSSLEMVLSELDALAPGNRAAKASVDIALHDWLGKRVGRSWLQMWGLDPAGGPLSSYTIGMGAPDDIDRRVSEAGDFPYLKVKLGGKWDKETVLRIRSLTDRPIRVDVNQGWERKEDALGMIEWLAGKGVELVEQPLRRDRLEDGTWLRGRSPLPIVADESAAGAEDVHRIAGAFDGVNVKLMKSGGMAGARKMMLAAREHGLKIMLGCMTETSCAISAAAQLLPMADWADLDGSLLIENDPFRGATIKSGRITLPILPGIGAEPAAGPAHAQDIDWETS